MEADIRTDPIVLATAGSYRCAGAALSAATWNIHGAVGSDGRYAPKRIFDVLSELGADVVALQEVPLQGPHGDFLVDLEHATGYHVAAGPLFQRRGIEFGNAVLSRHPFARVSHLDLTVERYEPRGAVDVHIAATSAARCASSPLILGCDRASGASR
jgi:endonuclease/exonuclease/phosphatase family metal-dependent hydrolase